MPMIHEVGLSLDREEDPAQVVQLEHGEDVRLARHRLLDIPGILVEDLSLPGMIFAMIEKP